MKHLILGLLLVCGTVHAQMDDSNAKASPHNLNVKAGFSAGGFAFGLGYEYMWDQAAGIGGEVRSYQKDSARGADGVMILGATLGHHFYKKAWDLAFTPSFNMISIDGANAGREDSSTFGPGLSIGLTWQMSAKVAVGFDHSQYWVWFDEDYRGSVMDDMAAKLKVSF